MKGGLRSIRGNRTNQALCPVPYTEFHIHRLRRNDGVSAIRAIETLEIELAAIMKGNFDHFMQKEIYEQASREFQFPSRRSLTG